LRGIDLRNQERCSSGLSSLRRRQVEFQLAGPRLQSTPLCPRLSGQAMRRTTLSRRIAQAFVRSHPLEIREPPYASPLVRTTMLWHRRLDRHPAHRWLRTVILSVSKNL
jgi:DNA-binding transcriptional LysR family regulator